VLSNVVRSKQKGSFTSTDGKYRGFTDDAAVKLRYLVKKHADRIANGEAFVDSCDGGVVLACVFYSSPNKVLPGGFAEGRMYERGILWIREQSEYCQGLNYNKGGGGATPKGVAKWRSAGGRRGAPAARRRGWFRREPQR
jgi:hypothetical protein